MLGAVGDLARSHQQLAHGGGDFGHGGGRLARTHHLLVGCRLQFRRGSANALNRRADLEVQGTRQNDAQ